jgi:hypothetical protein
MSPVSSVAIAAPKYAPGFRKHVEISPSAAEGEVVLHPSPPPAAIICWNVDHQVTTLRHYQTRIHWHVIRWAAVSTLATVLFFPSVRFLLRLRKSVLGQGAIAVGSATGMYLRLHAMIIAEEKSTPPPFIPSRHKTMTLRFFPNFFAEL